MRSEKNQTPIVTSVKENFDVSKEVFLFQNYPNPFTASTFISFSIPDPPRTGNQLQHVTLKIYSSDGNEISILLNDQRLPGYYDVEFNSGGLPKGIYYYELIVGSYHRLIKEMSLVK
jgi:hypothetical protein